MLILYPFLAAALSEEKDCYKVIDEIYYANEEKYFKAFEEDKYKNIDMALNGSVVQNEYYRKVVGILRAGDKDDNVKLGILLNELYPFVAKYFNKHPDMRVFKENDFIKECKSKVLNTKYNVNDLIYITSFALSLCLGNEIDIDESQLQTYYTTITGLLALNKTDLAVVPNEARKDIKPILKLINNDKKIDRNSSCFWIPPELNKKLKENDYSKFLEPINLILNLYPIDLDKVFKRRMLTDREITTLLWFYWQYNQNKFDDEHYEDIKRWLAVAVPIMYLAKAYNEANEYIKKNSSRVLIKKIDSVKNDNKTLSSKNDILLNSNVDLVEENKRLRKINENLEKELQQHLDERKELISLRNFVFSLNKKEAQYNNNSLDIIIDELNKKEFVIIGGHPSWTDKLKEVLTCKFISTDTLNFDINLLNDKYVILNTDYLSHGMYYKVIENINKAKGMFFISNVTNIDLSIKKIYDYIK